MPVTEHQEVRRKPKTSTGYDLIHYAGSVHDHRHVPVLWRSSSKDYYKRCREYRDVNHFSFADKFFVGVQADKWGNTNMISLGTRKRWRFAVPALSRINDVAVRVTTLTCS